MSRFSASPFHSTPVRRVALLSNGASLLVSALAAGSTTNAPAVDDATAATIAESIRDLKAEIAAYRAGLENPDGEWLTEARATEIRSLVTDVLQDADSRASLQSSGMTAGWNNGFFLQSADGNYRLAISGYAQIRWNLNHLDDPDPGQDRTAKGFENRRTYLTFDGHVVDPSWIYRIQGNFSRSGTLFLDDAYLRKNFEGGLYLQAGQAKNPFMRETLVSDTGLLTVDRSLVETEFGARRTQGIFGGWSNDTFRLTGVIGDGLAATGGYNTAWNTTNTEWSVTGRAEVKLGGEWSQFNDMTSFPGEELSALFGAAVLWQKGEYGTDDDELEVLQWTVDAEIDFGGANVFGSFVGRHLDSNAPGASTQDQYGLVVQGGYFILPTVELFARYEWADGDNDQPQLSTATAGGNWYIAKNRLKVSADFGYGFNPVRGIFSGGQLGPGGTASGWRTDALDKDGQWVIRTQIQFMF